MITQPWLINEQFAHSVMPMVNSFIKGDSSAFNQMASPTSKHVLAPDGTTLRDDAWRGIDCFSAAPEGSIAFMDIQGVIFKESQACGPLGTSVLMQQLNKAKSNPNIIGIILVTDTPGGQVAGTHDFAQEIASSKKPIVSFVNNMACSAGYWISSAATHIMASNELVQIGSIGVMCSIVDDSARMEKEGYKIRTVYATNSTQKNKPYTDALNGDDSLLTEELDQINAVFAKTISKNRKGKLANDESIFEGKVFNAKQAKKLGLIDSIGTMQDAISFIQTNHKSKSHTMKKNTAETHPQLCATLGFENGFESNEEGVHLSAEHIDTLEASLASGTQATADLATANALIAAHAAEGDPSAEALTAAQTELATAHVTIAELSTEIATLKGKPAHTGGAPAGGGDEIPEGDKNSIYVDDGSQALLDAMPKTRSK